jgi:Phage tail lysozyme
VTPATPSTRTRKIRRRGRHKAPSPVRKVAKRAGVAAPAVAVAGALAAAPHLHSLTASAPRVTGAATAHLVYPAQAANSASALPASQSRAEYRPRHASTPAPRPHPHHRAAPASPAPSPSATPSASSTPAAGSGQQAAAPPASTGHLSCSASASGPLPANYAAIVGFLTSHGYTGNAAAGIAGNIYQESGGNPESEGDGGGGLIGWTPLPGGYVTGNPAADLQTQLAAILAFNQIWSQYVPTLNAASSPAAAADIYVTDFERAGVPAAGTREAAAEAVAAACGI